MKRVASLLVLLMLVFAVPANAAERIDVDVGIITNRQNGEEFEFEIEWSIDAAKKGDTFIVEFPFPIQVDGKGIVEVESKDNKYKLTFIDDYINVKGSMGGKRKVNKQYLERLVVNGKAIEVDYNANNNTGGSDAGVAERQRIYKHGEIQGNKINWSVVIGGDEKGVNAGVGVTDEIGDGHKLIKDSVKFSVIENGQYNDRLVDMIVKDLETTDTSIDFIIDGLAPYEILLLDYQTIITDKEAGEYENMIIVEDEKKISEKVTTDSWGDINADKPEKPTEPEEPTKPTEPEEPPVDPEEPELPGTLPQVGEQPIKPQHIAGLGILLVGLVLNKKKDK